MRIAQQMMGRPVHHYAPVSVHDDEDEEVPCSPEEARQPTNEALLLRHIRQQDKKLVRLEVLLALVLVAQCAGWAWVVTDSVRPAGFDQTLRRPPGQPPSRHGGVSPTSHDALASAAAIAPPPPPLPAPLPAPLPGHAEPRHHHRLADLGDMPKDRHSNEFRFWHKHRADDTFAYEEPNDHAMQVQNDVIQVWDDAPLDCTILTAFMAFSSKPTRDQVENHLRHLACHSMTDFEALGVPHVYMVNEQEVIDVIYKHLKPPPHVQFWLRKDVEHRDFGHATMKIDDDDLVSVEYARQCCATKATDTVMYPARPYYYFEDIGVVQRCPFQFHTYGLCLFPNRHGANALNVKHTRVHELEGMKVALSGASGFYTRHSGNHSGDEKITVDPQAEGYQAGVVLRPKCVNFKLPDGLVDELHEVLLKFN